MKKIWWLAVVLLLAACRQIPVPVQVSFPDDPRVLHGTWRLQVLARTSGSDFQFDAAADNLVIGLSQQNHVRYARDESGWSEVKGGRPAGTYDDSLDAFVSAQRQEGRLRVTTQDFAGQTGESYIELPPDLSFSRFVIGSGRITGVVSSPGGETQVYWWDTGTGELQGNRSFAHHPDGMRVSTNGRVISFWHLLGNRATLVDTSRPEVPISLGLGVCRGSGTGEASVDGRWFVTVGCGSTMVAYDLHDPNATRRAFSISPWVVATMAADSPEILWMDEDSFVIFSHNVETGSRQALYTLSKDERDFIWMKTGPFYLNRAGGILAFNTGRGVVKIVDVGSGTEKELPPFELNGVVLSLQASAAAGRTPPFEQLDITGTWTHGAVELQVVGTLDGGSHHLYQPQDLAPAVGPPPPPAKAWLSVTNPEADPESESREVWSLRVETNDNQSPEYRGDLSSGLPGMSNGYIVKLVRP